MPIPAPAQLEHSLLASPVAQPPIGVLTVSSGHASAVIVQTIRVPLEDAEYRAPESVTACGLFEQGLSNPLQVKAPPSDGLSIVLIMARNGLAAGVALTTEIGTPSKTVAVAVEAFPVLPPPGVTPLLPAPVGPTGPLGAQYFQPRRLTVTVNGAAPTRVSLLVVEGGLLDSTLPFRVAREASPSQGAFILDAMDEALAKVVILEVGVGGNYYTRILRLPAGSFTGTVDVLTSGGFTFSPTMFSPSQVGYGGIGPAYPPTGVLAVRAPNVALTFQVARNSEQTLSLKTVKFQDQSSEAVVLTEDVASGYERTVIYSSAILGQWKVQVVDTAEPRLGSIQWPTVAASQVMRFNLSDSTGGDSGGDSGLVTTTVVLDGGPAIRPVVVIERLQDAKWRVVGFDTTDAAGVANVEVKVLPDTQVFAVAIDDWGVKFQPNLSVAVGDTIRPTIFFGWLYRITQAGNLPATEPVWWDETLAAPQPLGSARAEVVRYYRPLAHGPIPVEIL